MSKSIYHLFYDWLFDQDFSSEIPKEVLNYKSPITHQYSIKLFMKHGPLNWYLNKIFNNVWLWSLEKEELFLFLKRCIIDLNIQRSSIFYTIPERTTKIKEAIRKKFNHYRLDDCDLLSNIMVNNPKFLESIGIYQKIQEKDKKKKEEESSFTAFLSAYDIQSF